MVRSKIYDFCSLLSRKVECYWHFHDSLCLLMGYRFFHTKWVNYFHRHLGNSPFQDSLDFQNQVFFEFYRDLAFLTFGVHFFKDNLWFISTGSAFQIELIGWFSLNQLFSFLALRFFRQKGFFQRISLPRFLNAAFAPSSNSLLSPNFQN